MSSVLLRVRVAILALLTAAAMSACASQGRSYSTDVQVTLTDFKVETSTTEFTAGVPYTFTIVNRGQVPHEFLFIPPVMEGMTDMHGEATHNTALVQVSENDLPAGATYTLVYTFPASAVGADLEIACHTPGHYEAGMQLPVTVK